MITTRHRAAARILIWVAAVICVRDTLHKHRSSRLSRHHDSCTRAESQMCLFHVSCCAAGSTAISMSNRFNAKKNKAKRNSDNMRRFRKRGASKRSIVRGKRQQTAREKEADFMSKLFMHSDAPEGEAAAQA